MLPKLVLNFWAQFILLPQPSKKLRLQVHTLEPSPISHFLRTILSGKEQKVMCYKVGADILFICNPHNYKTLLL